ncbi:glycosyltransferase family 25 protein [Aggregatibacter kilianii]|uniref:glycosyltransferase family 25 protein n=1 Tax=Aggregatibacter kilianii TaxID=2025884 RepID=UPI0019550DDB|nr:glycosyltransferase family 25 protein [Aggregatibacter kilianii]
MNFTENKNFVISIPTADKRRNHIIEQFGRQNIPFEFFDAFTPSPELDSLIQWNLPQLDETTFTNGEKACFMSHLELWKKCIDEDLPYINIFEDDIYLGENADHFLSQDKWLVQRFDLSSKFIIHVGNIFNAY